MIFISGGWCMYQRSYTEFVKEDPKSEFSKFLIRFFNTKPDLKKIEREVREFDHNLAEEQKKELKKQLNGDLHK